LGEDAPKQGRNESKNSRDAEITFMGSAAVEMDMDVESGDNAADYVVADHEGNEVILDTLTQEQVVEKLKTLEPEQLVKASEVMDQTIQSLGDSATKVIEGSVASSSAQMTKDNSAARAKDTTSKVQHSTASAKDTADMQSVPTAKGYIMDEDVVMAQAIL
jgi:hypothetical protein